MPNYSYRFPARASIHPRKSTIECCPASMYPLSLANSGCWRLPGPILAFPPANSSAKKNYRPLGSNHLKRQICPAPHPRISSIEDSDDLPQALPLLLEFLDSLNSGKDLLIVQTVSGLCTFGFCNQTENRIVMNGLTSKARIPHHLANLVELPGNHTEYRCTDGVAAGGRSIGSPACEKL